MNNENIGYVASGTLCAIMACSSGAAVAGSYKDIKPGLTGTCQAWSSTERCGFPTTNSILVNRTLKFALIGTGCVVTKYGFHPSAAHTKRNPDSAHETGQAIDIHTVHCTSDRYQLGEDGFEIQNAYNLGAIFSAAHAFWSNNPLFTNLTLTMCYKDMGPCTPGTHDNHIHIGPTQRIKEYVP